MQGAALSANLDAFAPALELVSDACRSHRRGPQGIVRNAQQSEGHLWDPNNMRSLQESFGQPERCQNFPAYWGAE